MLQEYLKRLILEQPEDPIQFLIKSVSENPYKVEDSKTATSDADSKEWEPKEVFSPDLESGQVATEAGWILLFERQEASIFLGWLWRSQILLSDLRCLICFELPQLLAVSYLLLICYDNIESKVIFV